MDMVPDHDPTDTPPARPYRAACSCRWSTSRAELPAMHAEADRHEAEHADGPGVHIVRRALHLPAPGLALQPAAGGRETGR